MKFQVKAEWMITEDDIENWDILPPYRAQILNIAKIAQNKVLQYLYDYVSTWGHGVCIDDDCECPYSHIRNMIKQLRRLENDKNN